VDRIETRTNFVWLEGGVVRVREKDRSETDLSDAKLLVENIRKVTGGVRSPSVIDISAAKSVTREARAHFAGDAVAEVVTRMALVVSSPLARAIGSFFLSFNRPKTPVKLFATVDEALVWVCSSGDR
jgi:hypothetical protein